MISQSLDRTLSSKGLPIIPARGRVPQNRQALHFLAKLAESDSIGHPVWWVESRAHGITQPLITHTNGTTHALIFSDGSVLLRDDIRFLPLVFRLNTSKTPGRSLEDRTQSLLTNLQNNRLLEAVNHSSQYWTKTLNGLVDGFDPACVAPVFRNIPLTERSEKTTQLRQFLQLVILAYPWVQSLDIRTGLLKEFRGTPLVPTRTVIIRNNNTDPATVRALEAILDRILPAYLPPSVQYGQRWQFSDIVKTLSHRKTGDTMRHPLTLSIPNPLVPKNRPTFSAHEKTEMLAMAYTADTGLGQTLTTYFQ